MKHSETGWFAASMAKLIQLETLSEPESTLACILEIAQGMEAAHKQAQMLKTPDTITIRKVVT